MFTCDKTVVKFFCIVNVKAIPDAIFRLNAKSPGEIIS